MIVLGIDAGATKTHAALATEDGTVLGTGQAGCGNWEFAGMEGAAQALQTAVNQALTAAGLAAGDIAAAGVGLAGLDWPSDEARLKPLIEALALAGPAVTVNDAFLQLRAGTPDGVGVAANAGTGATVVGRNRNGKTDRSFGSGYPFTDWGGAGDLAGAAIHAVARSHIGLGPATALTDRMLAASGCASVEELLEAIMRWRVIVGSEFAPQIIQAAEEGDGAAAAIVRHAGRSIAANVVAVARRLGMIESGFDLVTAGGVFSSRSRVLVESLLEGLKPHVAVVRLSHWDAPPVVGALLLALDQVRLGHTPDAARLAKSLGHTLEVH